MAAIRDNVQTRRHHEVKVLCSHLSHQMGEYYDKIMKVFKKQQLDQGEYTSLVDTTVGDAVTLVAEEDGAELLILGGPALGAPIARYGPFVMNTRQEIYQAIEDYNNGTLA